MKRIIPLLLITLSFCYSQNWYQIDTQNIGDFKDITFVNADTGYIAIEGGEFEILQTIDGGKTWDGYNSNSWSGINSLFFVNKDTGFAVGGGAGGPAVIRKTYDAGTTWDISFPLSKNSIYDPALIDVSFQDSQTGYAVGQSGEHSGIILKTTNSAISWDSLSVMTDYPLNSIDCISNDVVYAVGSNGLILKTTSGGDVWQTYSNSQTNNLRAVSFISPDTGYIVGDGGTFFVTNDAGNLWTKIETNIPEDLYSIQVLNSHNIYVAGDNGAIYRSTDMGLSWESLQSDFSDRIQALQFIDDYDAKFVGLNALYGKSNFPPALLDSIADITISEDSGIHIVVKNLYNIFEDIDDSVLTFKAENEPDGLLIQVNDSSISISTVQDSFGIFPIYLSASDNYAQISDTFIVHVVPVNDKPEFVDIPDSVTLEYGKIYSLNIWDLTKDDQTKSSDIDYNFSRSDSNLTYGYNSETGNINFSSSGFSGDIKFFVQATDDSNTTATDSIQFNISLSSVENFRAEARDQAIILFWTPITEEKLSHYNLYRNTEDNIESSSLIKSPAKSDSSYIDSNLVNYTNYFYWISAVDSFGNESTISELVEIAPIDMTPPSMPTISFIRSYYDRELRIYINPSDATDFDHFNLYRNTIYDSLSSQLKSKSNETRIVDKDILSGYYFYWVSAVDIHGNESILSNGDSIFVAGRVGISGLGPVQNAVGVDTESKITVTFNRKIDASKLNSDNLLVKGKYGVTYQPDQLHYDNTSLTLTFNPDKPFLHGDLVTVTLKGIVDSTGEEVPAMPYQWQFTTNVLDTSVLYTNIVTHDTESESIKSSAAGDFDGDGDIDIAISGERILIYKNQGKAGFEYDTPVNISPTKMIPIDFDNDFDLDIIAYQGFRIYLLTNDGSGHFSTYQYPVGEYYNATNILLTDWGLDGYPCLWIDGGSIYYVHNDSGAITYEVYWGLRSFGSVGGDIDNDGLPDFINLKRSNDIAVSFGNGKNGSGFNIYDTTYTINGNPGSYVQTDLNGDSYLDLVVTNETSNNINLFYNDGNGRFPNQKAIPFDVTPKILTYADLDGNNTIDFLISLEEKEKWIVLTNDGKQNFIEEDLGYYEPGDATVLAADFDNNGILDFIVTNPSHEYFTYLNSGELPLEAPQEVTANMNENNHVELSWSPPAANIKDYLIYRGTDSLNLDLLSSTTNTSFIDSTITKNGDYFYAVKSTNSSGFQSSLSDLVKINVTLTDITDQVLPLEYSLSQNFPNPFNPQTTIKYGLKKAGNVRLTIYDNLGRKIKELINTYQSVGYHQIVWNGTNSVNEKVSSGIYYYRLKTEKFTSLKKMVYIK